MAMKPWMVVLLIAAGVLCFLARWGKLVPAVAPVEYGLRPVVVLDAGHGGEDGGAVTGSGHRESDINLQIVQKLDYFMALCGVETVLTRTEDVSLHTPGADERGERKQSDLDYRAQLVEQTPGAMLISIHQNQYSNPSVSGAQVFYSVGDVARQWGEFTQQTLRDVVDTSNTKKAKQIAPDVYLFSHITRPALLVECGFLSNGLEASLLLTDDYQTRLSLAITGAYLHQLQMMNKASGGI